MEEQPGDDEPGKFSFTDTPYLKKQRPCHITFTNKKTHQILEKGFEKSPLFTGRIQGLGPRYCPSIEDKIVRFADKDRHQLFVEPEGWSTVEIYVNGFSSSLPEDVQFNAMRTIPGFENARMFRPGYAIEYDFFQPTQVKLTLETRLVENLYFAGQINGTTGYEEAGAQGLMAGINASLKNKGEEPLIFKRDQAYIGVLIDDLVNKGTDEPYRMFTSRAEYRILLRQDNADLRLTEIGHSIGLASEERYARVLNKKKGVEFIQKSIEETSIAPEDVNPFLATRNSSPIKQKLKVGKVLTRPGVMLKDLMELSASLNDDLKEFPEDVLKQAEIQLKYAGYIRKEKEMADKMVRLDDVILPESFEYEKIKALSNEGREKLKRVKPASLGQASRISGITPSDISILMVYIGR